MSEDYVTMIRGELAPPVDVMGVSSGGSIAQHFVADHPGLVRRLVLAATAYRQSEEADQLGMRVRDLSLQGKWRAASAAAAGEMTPKLAKRFLLRLLSWIFPTMYSSAGPSDGIVEIEAQRGHNFKERLPDIKAPTLVVGGDIDFYFPATLMRETAAGIPNARLILHEGLGHEAAFSKRLAKDVVAFLAEAAAK
jgi:pimeloyl-ACP methyl ester carboxylesterase